MLARTFPWERLPTALEMEAAGKSAQKIWQEAGLERNAAGNWVFNIPDKGYRIRPRAGEPTMWPPLTHAPLYEHHVHPGMQEAYPGLADTQSFLSVAPHERPYGEQPSLRPGNSSGAESWRGQERRHPRTAAFGRPAREASSWRVAALFQ
jgi:hypothetical protein